jgi:hypothetical protein
VKIPKTTNERQKELVLALAVREAQDSFCCFRQFMHPDFKWGWWQYEVAHHLQKFIEEYRLGQRPKLVLQCPPQHGKSEFVVDLVAWCLGHDPNTRIIFASYSDHLGSRANHKLQHILTSDRFKLVFETRINEGRSTLVRSVRNNEMIEITGANGYFRNTTVGGPITGESLDIGVIDDPIKGRAEADSRLMRDKTYQWYTDDFMTRFSDQAAQLIVMTRWHTDDLVGRLLQKDPKVKVLRYPALAEGDERFRKKGEALFPEFKSPDFLLERKRALPESSWQALYQQNPIVVGGGLFPIEKIRGIPAMPDRQQIKMSVRAWDKGATAGGGDYTVGVLMLAMKDGTYLIADIIRGQWSALDREREIKAEPPIETARCFCTGMKSFSNRSPARAVRNRSKPRYAPLPGSPCVSTGLPGQKPSEPSRSPLRFRAATFFCRPGFGIKPIAMSWNASPPGPMMIRLMPRQRRSTV